MKKMKSLSEFKRSNVMSEECLTLIQGGGRPTEYFVGVCTDVYEGGDCQNYGYYDSGTPSTYVGPVMPIGC
ncbi:MAG TPA: hypothetical protein VKY36_00615 [Moheibacter sp.]|nr:hypothetical protein [Moheibacter sp.]